MIHVRILLFTAILLTGLFIAFTHALMLLPVVLLVMLIRNPGFTLKWLLCMLPGTIVIGVIAWVSGTPFQAVITAGKMMAVSSGFLLYFGFFPNKRLKYLLHDSGLPFMGVFIISSAVNISYRIRDIYWEVRDAQKLRGIDIKPSIPNIPKYAALFVPVFIRSLRMADILGISIYQRGIGRPFNDRRISEFRTDRNIPGCQSEEHILPGHNSIPHLHNTQDSRQSL